MSGKGDIELALKKVIEDGDDENLYYQYEKFYYQHVKNEDELIPYRTMHKREMKNFEAHNKNMIPLFKESNIVPSSIIEWEHQKKLAKNSLERAIQWSRRAKKEEESVNN